MIKVCGMTDSANIRAVEALGIDMMGFIFWPKSKRFCAEKPDYLPTQCKRVGVFVNASIEDVVQKYVEYGLDAIQLHGDEDKLYVWDLRKAIGALPEDEFHPYQLIKAVQVEGVSDFKAKCEPLVGFVDYFLFDTPSAGRGGTGQNFDWSLLNAYQYPTPFLLSGGIGPESLPKLRRFKHPFCEGFDLNSCFETEPGMKDVRKIRDFLIELN